MHVHLHLYNVMYACPVHSAPSSLTSDQILQPPPSTSGSSHRPRPPVPPISTSTRSRRVEAGRSGSSASRRGTARGQATGGVTGDTLQQALANAFSTIQTPSRAAQVNHHCSINNLTSYRSRKVAQSLVVCKFNGPVHC